MSVWRISVINRILNFRKVIFISADTYVHAIDKAQFEYGKLGYREIESCRAVLSA